MMMALYFMSNNLSFSEIKGKNSNIGFFAIAWIRDASKVWM